MGGSPQPKDLGILRSCTHSILLLKESEPQKTQIWRDFVLSNGLQPLAEITSLDPNGSGVSQIHSRGVPLIGDLTGLDRRKKYVSGDMITLLVERIKDLFTSYPREELERLHFDKAPEASEVRLEQSLASIAPDAREWSPDLLVELLELWQHHSRLALYGRAPLWVYCALALHAQDEPFYQFDPRLGWVEPPVLQAGNQTEASDKIFYLDPQINEASFTLTIVLRPQHQYLDYDELEHLIVPEPPAERGVILNGKLPLWAYTALVRFYARRAVPWIAVYAAHYHQAIVVYSSDSRYPLGKFLPLYK
jgi:CRISPR-associated protein Csx3